MTGVSTKITSLGKTLLLAFLIAGPFCACKPGKTGSNEISSEVFISGQDAYSTYRIPSLALNDEFIFAFAEGRRHGSADHGEISIVLKRSKDWGKTWSNMITVVESAGESAQNPTPVWVDGAEKMILLFTKRTVGSDTEYMIRNGTSEGYMGVYKTESFDLGLTWTEPMEITDKVKKEEWNWYAVGPGGAIIMTYNTDHKGRIIVPANHSLNQGSGNEYLGAHIIWSDDNGNTWNIGAADSKGASTVNPNETAVVELNNGDLYCNTRNHSGEDSIAHRAIAISSDGGLTFDSLFRHEPGLTTPIVHASLARSKTSVFFVAPYHWNDRINLSLWISTDETASWQYNRLLHEGPSAYSSVCMVGPNALGVLFEAGNYEKIVFKSIPLKHGQPR